MTISAHFENQAKNTESGASDTKIRLRNTPASRVPRFRSFASLAVAVGALALSTACGGPVVQLDGEAFRVLHVSPSHGAINVGREATPLVAFSHPISPESVSEVIMERSDNGILQSVEVQRFLEDEGNVVELIPRQLLDADTVYEITVSTSVETVDAEPLLTAYRARFSTGSE